MQPGQKRRSHEILELVQGFASNVVLAMKHELNIRRPDGYSAQVQPIVPTPGHGSLPSGHATESYATAVVLSALLKDHGDASQRETMLLRQAGRIAVNRTVAGLHFPIDSIAGAELGVNLGHYFLARAQSQKIGKYRCLNVNTQ